MIVTTITNSSGHQLAQVQVGATNYIETESNIAMGATNHQRQGLGQLSRSVCRQHYTAQVTSSNSYQYQADHNYWPPMVVCGGDQWPAAHNLHVNQDPDCAQKPVNESSFYDYIQVKFSTPAPSYHDSVRSVPSDETMAQQHSYQASINHQSHQYDQRHYYNQTTTNQVQVGYNVPNARSSNQDRVYHQDISRDRYPSSSGHDNQGYGQEVLHSQQSSAGPATSSGPCPPAYSLYQQNHRYYTTTVEANTSTRLALADEDGKCRQINTGNSANELWMSNAHYQDYGSASSHKSTESIQIADQPHNWPMNATPASVGPAPMCSRQSSDYEYYRPECTADRSVYALNTDTAINDYHPNRHGSSSSSLSTGNYQANGGTSLALAATNVPKLEQAEGGSFMGEKSDSSTSVFHDISVIRNCKPTGVQLEQQQTKKTQRDNKTLGELVTVGKNQLASVHGDRLNQCRICGRHYARPSTLKTHLRTHTNERPYKCAVCRKTFSQAANLTAHQRVHTGERPFPCPICGRQFSQSSSVITHLRTHSGERPYRCNMCNRTFSDSSTLTKHCRIHSGEKPYQCDHCPMNFSQSGNLSRHLRLHSIGSLNKTHQAASSTTTTVDAASGASVVTASASSATPTSNQRNHSTNPSSSPESTLSNYSISSRVSSGASN